MAAIDETELLNLAVAQKMLSRQIADSIAKDSQEQNAPVENLLVMQGHMTAGDISIIRALQKPESVAPNYRVEGVLGEGGYGTVYRAVQINMAREVALKTIALAKIQDVTATSRFEREAQIIGKLRHPNIVTAYDFGLHNERLFLSMELIDGIDLEQALTKFNPSEIVTWHIIRQVVMALAYAAENGITHRDIKPGNLMLTKPPLGYALPDRVPMVKATDFGLACFSENNPEHRQITMPESGLGTPSYVAPEQMAGVQVDSRADIYSVGATAFHLVNGIAPFHDMRPIDAILKKASGDETWLEEFKIGVSSESRDLIVRMAAFDRENRIQTQPELLTEIDQILKTLEDSDLAGNPIEESESWEDFRTAGPPVVREKSTDSQMIQTTDFSSSIEKNAKLKNTIEHIGENVGDSDGFEIAKPESSTPVEASKTISTDRSVFSRYRKIAMLAVIVTALSVLGWASGMFSGLTEKHEVELSLDNESRPNLLFDGMSVGFRNRGGTWEATKDSEGALVLGNIGDGSRTFECADQDGTPFQHCMFNIGVNLNNAESIRFEIERIDESGKKSIAGIVDVTSTGISFGQEDVSGKFLPIKPPMEMSELGQNRTFGYPKFRIERHQNFWRTTVEGMSLGEIHDESSSASTTIKLIVEGGQALFEDIYVQRLVLPKQE